MHRPPPHAARVLAENRRHYDLLVDVVRRNADRGDVERVLRSATFAATYGWLSPVGLLSDPDLERLVVDAVNGGTTPTLDGSRHGGRVLHVLTEAYPTGGHTRLAWRWMERDPRPSHVALTAQREPVPPPLVAAARAKGSEVHDLGGRHPEFSARAVALRALMDDSDLVVLHVHPNDAVALAAVNLPGERPPVIYENHADHAYWLGLGAADVVNDLREGATWLSTRLRGISAERIAVLPLPLETPSPAPTAGADLRAQLGIRPDAVVAVSVAAEFKVAATWGKGMDRLIERALAWSPQLAVVLAGTPSTGAWARLAKQYPGRFFAVGHVQDPAPWYALGDVYLDSYPTRAVTSVLEAALLEVPVLTMQDIPEDRPEHIYQADSPGLVGLARVSTREQYALALRRLVDDPERRAREGALVADSVRRVHQGQGWLDAMERLYAKARTVTACTLDEAPGRIEHPGYGGFYVGYTPSLTSSPDPRTLNAGVAERGDVIAAFERSADRPLQVRAGAGWEHETAWTTRLLSLAAAHPRLAVSLPFIKGDDAQGTRSVERITALLAAAGRTPEDCGDVSLSMSAPFQTGAAFPDRLAFASGALDLLEAVLTSPVLEPQAAVAAEG